MANKASNFIYNVTFRSVPYPTETMRIVVGQRYLSKREPEEMVFDVEEVIKHPRYE